MKEMYAKVCVCVCACVLEFFHGTVSVCFSCAVMTYVSTTASQQGVAVPRCCGPASKHTTTPPQQSHVVTASSSAVSSQLLDWLKNVLQGTGERGIVMEKPDDCWPLPRSCVGGWVGND